MPSTGLMQLADATQEAIRGYNLDSASDVSPDLICSICLHPAFKGVMTTCEHVFHQDCLEQAVTPDKSCPNCRDSLEDSQPYKPHGRVMSNILGGYRVQCPQACGNEIEFGQLERHVKEYCSNTPFGCPHEGCDQEALMRPAAEQHAECCEHRQVACVCDEVMKSKDLKRHQDTTCPQQPTTCGYCKEGGIRRGDMEKHLRESCNAASATISLLKPMQDVVDKLKDQVEQLKPMQEMIDTLNKRVEILSQADEQKQFMIDSLNKQVEIMSQADGRKQFVIDRLSKRVEILSQADEQKQFMIDSLDKRVEIMTQANEKKQQNLDALNRIICDNNLQHAYRLIFF